MQPAADAGAGEGNGVKEKGRRAVQRSLDALEWPVDWRRPGVARISLSVCRDSQRATLPVL